MLPVHQPQLLQATCFFELAFNLRLPPRPPISMLTGNFFATRHAPPRTNTSTLRSGGAGGSGPQHHKTQLMTHAKQLATFTTSTVIEFVLGVTFANGSAAVNGQPFAQQPPVAEVFLLDRVPWTNCLMLPSGAETCLEDRACRKKNV